MCGINMSLVIWSQLDNCKSSHLAFECQVIAFNHNYNLQHPKTFELEVKTIQYNPNDWAPSELTLHDGGK